MFPDSLVIVLLVAILIGILVLIARSFKSNQEPNAIESLFRKIWTDSGIKESVGKLETYASDVREAHFDIEQMLRIPHERADIGHIGLEVILCDQFPPERVSLGQELFNGLKPDAAIDSTAGWICIDSKFPLEGYAEIVNFAGNDGITSLKNKFKQKVKGHLDEVATKYVCPEKNTADFAFAYIPSEAVYYFLVKEQYDLLKEFTLKGVQVVSPLTLCHKVQLIKAGISTKQLSEEAREIKNHIKGLQSKFDEIDKLWETFFEKHLKNAQDRANDLNKAYAELKSAFEGAVTDKSKSEQRSLLK